MSEVVRGVLLAADELLRVEQLAVSARADLVNHGRLQVDEHRAGHVLARASLGEEGVERIVATTDGLVRRHLTVRLDTVLKAEQLPTSVTDLRTGLAHVDEDRLTHGSWMSLGSRKLEEQRAKVSCNAEARNKKLEPKWLRLPICAPA